MVRPGMVEIVGTNSKRQRERSPDNSILVPLIPGVTDGPVRVMYLWRNEAA
jgi:hypothetical protein